jgi:hypothetical protein
MGFFGSRTYVLLGRHLAAPWPPLPDLRGFSFVEVPSLIRPALLWMFRAIQLAKSIALTQREERLTESCLCGPLTGMVESWASLKFANFSVCDSYKSSYRER